MLQHDKDPIVNIIYRQIEDPIKLCLEHGHFSAGVKLIYAGIDTMAFLMMPATNSKGKKREKVERDDFINWVEQYLHFEGDEQLSGLDVYGARCSMLHNHSIYSELSKLGKCRWVGYTDKMHPPVRFDPKIHKQLVMVSVPDLAEAFFSGVRECLIDLFSDLATNQIARQRLDDLVKSIDISHKKK